MSHFIQDNQCVVETTDEVLLLLIKGGDNNCSSWNNNRVSSWRVSKAFKSYKDLMFFVNLITMEDIRGGMWQFQSLKNKTLKGFLEYESIAINRFKKAYNTRMKVDFNFSDITIENVEERLLKVEEVMKSKGFKIINEDSNYAPLCKEHITRSQEDFNNWKNYITTDYKKVESDERIKAIESYDEFVEKFKDKDIVECMQEMEFVEKYVNMNGFCKSDILVSNKIGSHNVSYEIFKAVISKDLKNFIATYDYYFKETTERYPLYIRDIKKEFLKDFENIVSSLSDTYDSKRSNDNLELLKSFSDMELENMQAEIDRKLEEEKKAKVENAKEIFETQWNSLCNYAYYKNTNEKLPREVEIMNKAYETNSFKLEDINKGYKYSLISLINKHQTQYKKNKKAIKDLVQLLFDRYSVLIREDEKERLETYFKIKVKKENKINNLKVATTIGVALYSQDILDIFANGTLF